MSHSISILLVEDEAIIALNLRLKLIKAGYDVFKVVSTGEEAIARAEQEQPDVILMDTRLAGKMDGIEAAQRIRSRRDVPVILLTGYPQDETFMARAKTVNLAACLEKPVSIQDLQEVIDPIFGR
jgi:CheY-like chemotaxis protein